MRCFGSLLSALRNQSTKKTKLNCQPSPLTHCLALEAPTMNDIQKPLSFIPSSLPLKILLPMVIGESSSSGTFRKESDFL